MYAMPCVCGYGCYRFAFDICRITRVFFHSHVFCIEIRRNPYIKDVYMYMLILLKMGFDGFDDERDFETESGRSSIYVYIFIQWHYMIQPNVCYYYSSNDFTFCAILGHKVTSFYCFVREFYEQILLLVFFFSWCEAINVTGCYVA